MNNELDECKNEWTNEWIANINEIWSDQKRVKINGKKINSKRRDYLEENSKKFST